MRILVAEDEATNALLLESILTRQGYEVEVARDGNAAFMALQQGYFDGLITDWMMPGMDGIALIKAVRKCIPSFPVILLVTSVSMPAAREHALESGADGFINKPFMPQEVLDALQHCLSMRQQAVEAMPVFTTPVYAEKKPFEENLPQRRPAPFVGVGITANTGGAAALNTLFETFPDTYDAAFIIVLQAPVWALDMFAMRLQKLTPLQVVMAEDGMALAGGTVYIARKDRHITVAPESFRIQIVDGPEENFTRPSADILFKSMAQVFGPSAIGVVMSGIGRDGAFGAAEIAAQGGHIIVQDPQSAEAPFLPKTIIDMKLGAQSVPLPILSMLLSEQINLLNDNLAK